VATALNHLLDTARARGEPFKVAVIASRFDLGAITSLWAHPQQYAIFLSREIGTFLRGQDTPLLIVMPTGFGVVDASASVRHSLASVHIPSPASATQLTQAAIAAVEAMARARGHPLPPVSAAVLSTSSGGGGGGGAGRWILIACVVVALAGGVLIAMSMRTRRATATADDGQ
jgi:hypothetical protein